MRQAGALGARPLPARRERRSRSGSSRSASGSGRPRATPRPPPNAQAADFAIRGEVQLKQLSTRLPASGLVITKTALTSWTLKALETATGEEVYLSTRLPTGQSWASEEQALADIGKLVGDEFSRNFFLQHFNFPHPEDQPDLHRPARIAAAR